MRNDAGINSVLLRPWSSVKIEKTPQGPRIESLGEEAYVQTARNMVAAGMSGPLIVDYAGLESQIGRQLGAEGYLLKWINNPQVAKLYVDVLRQVRQAVEETGMKQVWFFPFDEPGVDPYRRKLVLRQSELAHRAGLKTFLTSYVTQFNQGPGRELFDTVIQHATSPEEAIQRRTQAQARKGKWMFLAGAYVDGEAKRNRMTGLYLLRSKADGVAFWIWRSVKGNVWNDFDAWDKHESKDAVIAYPPLPEVGWDEPVTETVQWVGMRQAYQDFQLYRALRKKRNDLPNGPLREKIEGFLSHITTDFSLGEEFGDLPVVSQRTGELLAKASSNSARQTPADLSGLGAEIAGLATPQRTVEPVTLRPHAIAQKSAELTLDGKLAAEEWNDALTIDMLNGITGKPSGERHVVKYVARPDGLSVAFRCAQENCESIRQQAENNSMTPWANTSVELFLDSNADRIDYIQIVVDAANNVWTGYNTGANHHKKHLEGIETATMCEEGFFTTEIFIPWDSMVETPRLNTWRTIVYLNQPKAKQREDRCYAWPQPTTVFSHHDIEKFGPVYLQPDHLAVESLTTARRQGQLVGKVVLRGKGLKRSQAQPYITIPGEGTPEDLRVDDAEDGKTTITWSMQPEAEDPAGERVTLVFGEENLALRLPPVGPDVFVRNAPVLLLRGVPNLWTIQADRQAASLELVVQSKDKAEWRKVFPLQPGVYQLALTIPEKAGLSLNDVSWALRWKSSDGNVLREVSQQNP